MPSMLSPDCDYKGSREGSISSVSTFVVFLILGGWGGCFSLFACLLFYF